jgi:hypothetical protein
MGNQTYNLRRSWDRSIVDLFARMTYAPTAAVGTLATATPIVLTKVALGSIKNTNTVALVVAAPTVQVATHVKIDVTGTAAATIITVTPNSVGPVNVTSAQLVEYINTGAIAAIPNLDATDVGALRALITAAGGGAIALAHLGEGDGLTATMAGAIDFTYGEHLGVASAFYTATGIIRLNLYEPWPLLKDVHMILEDSTARNFTFQIKAESVSAAAPYVDMYTLTNGVATNIAVGGILLVQLSMKNLNSIL